MKTGLLWLLALCLLCPTAHAGVIPPQGVSQEFAAFTGLTARPAVVLCDSLTVCDERNGIPIHTLRYGDSFLTTQGWDGWADCYAADGSVQGWVQSDYILTDPAWYETDAAMQVYAYPDFAAPRVALLDAGARLPILQEQEDWLVVSLRAASGWIRKTPQDQARLNAFQPHLLGQIAQAALHAPSGEGCLNDPHQLAQLADLLVNAKPIGQGVAGCPFTAHLFLTLADGSSLALSIATDSCCVYRVDGWDYQYAQHLRTEENGADNRVLFELFGLTLSY